MLQAREVGHTVRQLGDFPDILDTKDVVDPLQSALLQTGPVNSKVALK